MSMLHYIYLFVISVSVNAIYKIQKEIMFPNIGDYILGGSDRWSNCSKCNSGTTPWQAAISALCASSKMWVTFIQGQRGRQTETITVCLFPICLSLSQTIVAIQCISQNYCQLYRHQFIISTNTTKDIITKWFKEWTCHGVCTVCTLGLGEISREDLNFKI